MIVRRGFSCVAPYYPPFCGGVMLMYKVGTMAIKNLNEYERLIIPAEELTTAAIPLYGNVSAGYPAEAYNYIEDRIDLNKRIIRNKSGNRSMWVTNRELLAPGITYGDLLVFDTKLNPGPKTICLYYIDDEYSLRWIEKEANGIRLVCPNPEVSDVYVGEGETIEQKGVLTHRLKKFENYHKHHSAFLKDARNYSENGMDYNTYFLGEEEYWETIFYLRVDGESMSGDWIVKGDLLVIDRLGMEYNDSIFVFLIENQFTLKRIVQHKDYIALIGSNPKFPEIRVPGYVRLEPWGVLTGTITDYRKSYEVLYSLRPE